MCTVVLCVLPLIDLLSVGLLIVPADVLAIVASSAGTLAAL